jgi:hypothetical protein
MSPGRCTAVIASALVTFASMAPALAAPETRSRVTVVRTASSDPLIREANTRLRAELTEAGFEVLEVDRPQGAARDEVESASEETRSFATVAIERAGPGATADIWINDLVTGKTVVRRLSVGSESNAAAVLAIRALELLRASLLEVAVPAESTPAAEPRAAPPADVMTWVEPARPRPPRAAHALGGPALSAGVLGLHSFQGIGPALGPVLRGSLGIGPHAFGRLTLASAFAAPTIVAEGGEADVAQHFGSFELGWVLGTEPAAAYGFAGLGAYYLRTSGRAEAPLRASSDGVVSALATAGVGGIVRLRGGVALSADVALLGLVPQPVVMIAGQEVGKAGAPSLTMSVALVVEL